MEYVTWNPWHGCHKISEGCKHCYVYRQDAKHDKDSSVVSRTLAFDLPIKKKRDGSYKIASGTEVDTCFTSDFLLEDADPWRDEVWKMIRTRSDLRFFIITKRIDRLAQCLPSDWGEGYENVCIACTVENQKQADYRLPIYLAASLRHKIIICAPLLEQIELSKYLDSSIEKVAVGGESGTEARLCDYDWVLDIRRQCVERGVPFWFQQTGAFFRKDGKVYRILRQFQHSQARKAGISTTSI